MRVARVKLEGLQHNVFLLNKVTCIRSGFVTYFDNVTLAQ
jgi:hypothetical protein